MMQLQLWDVEKDSCPQVLPTSKCFHLSQRFSILFAVKVHVAIVALGDCAMGCRAVTIILIRRAEPAYVRLGTSISQGCVTKAARTDSVRKVT